MPININLAYQWSIDKCNAPNIGYSQNYRDERTVNGITYYDCSSFIWYALQYAGFDVVGANGGSTWPFTTYTMDSILTLLGFTKLSIYSTWQPCDIVLRTDHCEFVYDGLKTMGAHSSSYPLDRQVSINTFDSSPANWDDLYRYPVSPYTPNRKRMPFYMMLRRL